MRLIKMFGLNVFAALAAIALVDATASADTLCHNATIAHSGECPAANRVAIGANVVGLAKSSQLLNASKENIVTCDSTILGKVIENEGSHKGLRVLVTSWKSEPCEGLCKKATGEGLPILLLTALTLVANVLQDPPAGAPGWTYEECSFGVHCLYTINLPVVLEIVEDLLVAKNEPMTRGTLCTLKALFTEQMFWDAKYLLQLDNGGKHEGALFVTALP